MAKYLLLNASVAVYWPRLTFFQIVTTQLNSTSEILELMTWLLGRSLEIAVVGKKIKEKSVRMQKPRIFSLNDY